jgi:hypothetical protein
MNLVTARNNDCVAASLAMAFDINAGEIKSTLFTGLPKPFPAPWNELPKVPDMNVICNWAWGTKKIALVPFEYNPKCTPHKDCPPVPVWEDPDGAFAQALSYGEGLLEGVKIKAERGHMCAWDGQAIYDPRGCIYSRNVAEAYFDFRIRRFWLLVKSWSL